MERLEIRPGRWVGTGAPAYIIAEVGANFDASLDKALKLVDLAKEAGCDAVKFQTFTAESLLSKKSFTMRSAHQSRWDKTPWEMYKSAEFPMDWHEEVARHCRAQGIDFFSSPYSEQALEHAIKLGCEIIKIGSGEIDNLDFLRACAATRKTILIAAGASTIGDIDLAMRTLREAGTEKIALLQCITSYPTPFEHANLRAMVTLRQAFDVPVGYSDHTPGIAIPIAAVALGGCIIEKHFTDSRQNAGPDHPHSLEPHEMKAMVEAIRAVESGMGDGQKGITPVERETSIIQRRSLHALRDIAAGEPLTRESVGARRPATGIKPPFLEVVLGRKARRDIGAGEALQWEDL